MGRKKVRERDQDGMGRMMCGESPLDSVAINGSALHVELMREISPLRLLSREKRMPHDLAGQEFETGNCIRLY
jgi:hypothetical protein